MISSIEKATLIREINRQNIGACQVAAAVLELMERHFFFSEIYVL